MFAPALLLEWWNLTYLIPFGFGFLLLLMQLAGLAGKDIDLEVEGEAAVALEADAGVEVDADLDADVDADVDVDADADLDADVEADADLESEADVDAELDADADGHLPATTGDKDVEVATAGFMMKAAALLGVGRVPLSVVVMNGCFTWGVYGLVLNSTLRPLLWNPRWFFPVSLVGTVILSAGTTGLVSRLMGRYMPTVSTTSSRDVELEGRVGETLYKLRVGKTGTVRVEDRHGNALQYSAYTTEGEDIPGGTPVLLTRWDKTRKAFEVEVAPAELAP